MVQKILIDFDSPLQRLSFYRKTQFITLLLKKASLLSDEDSTMTISTEQPKEHFRTLYETDFNLWLEETANLLRQRKLDQLDIENLLEEIEAMGRSEKRAMVSLLTRLFEHLLKLTYWTAQQEYNTRHWRGEILNFRKQIQKELKASPSLKPYLLEMIDECYQDAKEIVTEITGLPIERFPKSTIANLEQVLNKNWFPPAK